MAESTATFILSPHAIDRFGSRWRPDLTSFEAKHELYNAIRRAKRVGPTLGGDLWQTNDEVPIPFVVRNDPKTGPVVVTVLPKEGAAIEQDDLEEVVAAYQRLTRPSSMPPLAPEVAARRSAGMAENWLNLEIARQRALAAESTRLAAIEKGRAKLAALAASAPQKKAEPSVDPAAVRVLEQRLQSKANDIERLHVAIETQKSETKKARTVLKVAIRALISMADDDRAVAAVEEIGKLEPGFLVPAFYAGLRFSSEERKRQAEEARRLATGERHHPPPPP